MSATDESNEARAMRKARQLAQAEQRKARAAQKLRENLMRRKAQLRARRAGEADMTDGLPAAKTDESES
jgi:hypothetical protein